MNLIPIPSRSTLKRSIHQRDQDVISTNSINLSILQLDSNRPSVALSEKFDSNTHQTNLPVLKRNNRILPLQPGSALRKVVPEDNVGSSKLEVSSSNSKSISQSLSLISPTEQSQITSTIPDSPPPQSPTTQIIPVEPLNDIPKSDSLQLPYQFPLIHQVCINGDLNLLIGLSNYCSLDTPDPRTNQTPLILAVINNRYTICKYLLSKKESVAINHTDNSGKTAIFYACIFGYHKILNLLLKCKVKVDFTISDQLGRTALHYAVMKRSKKAKRNKCVEILLRYILNTAIEENRNEFSILENAVNHMDNQKMTPLHCAASENQFENMATLIKYCKVAKSVSVISKLQNVFLSKQRINNKVSTSIQSDSLLNWKLCDGDGQTALHLLSTCKQAQSYKCVDLLIKNFPNIINFPDTQDRTMLHLCSAENNIYLLSKLLSSHYSKLDINARDNKGRTVIHFAAAAGHVQVLKILFEICGDDARDDVFDFLGATALHYACSRNHVLCVLAFFEREKKVYEPDKFGRVPLLWAAKKGHARVCEVLLEKGVDPNRADNKGETALHFAALGGHIMCATVLITNKAEINQKDNSGYPPLFRAVQRGLADMVSFLISHNGNSEIQDNEGRTALHWAALNGHIPVISVLLLSKSGLLNMRDFYGKTPLFCAVYYRNNHVVKFLAETGADLNAQDLNGVSVTHIASESSTHFETLQLLLQLGANPNVPDFTSPDRQTPLDYAISSENHEAIKYLRSFTRNSPNSKRITVVPMTGKELKQYSAIVIQKCWRGKIVRVRMRDWKTTAKIFEGGGVDCNEISVSESKERLYRYNPVPLSQVVADSNELWWIEAERKEREIDRKLK
ncbi:hypothetical protein HK098_006498 [Nowakowskiella sp. JEL0407]|nr:hypothetical protein HK098_006498 [Nowakowskiella sp. JEL0407]